MKHLSVDKLTVQLGSHTLLSDMNFKLYPGELCALIGPSGAGKSTLIKAMLGMIQVQGSIRLPERRKPIAYVPQDDFLHTGLKVTQALGYACQLRLKKQSEAARAKHIQRIASEVGLGERLQHRIKNLSGGQRKRVSVALELITQPEFMILDEPTSGLDPGMEAQLMQLFVSIAQKQKIVLVATHNMQSLNLCHHVMLMMQGHLIFFGPPKLLLKWFKVARFEDVFPRLQLDSAQNWARKYVSHPFSKKYARRIPKQLEQKQQEAREATSNAQSALLETSDLTSAEKILQNIRQQKKT